MNDNHGLMRGHIQDAWFYLTQEISIPLLHHQSKYSNLICTMFIICGEERNKILVKMIFEFRVIEVLISIFVSQKRSKYNEWKIKRTGLNQN